MFAEIEILMKLFPLLQDFDQFSGGENVVSHGGQAGVSARYRRRIMRFFGKGGHHGIIINGKDAESSARPHCETSSAARVRSAPVHAVVVDHLADIHLVDVIAAEYGHIVRIRGLDKSQVLENGIGGAFEPLLAFGAGLGRDGDVEFAEAGPFAP